MNAGVYHVYILASGRHGTLNIGMTNNLRTRLEQHRSGRGSEFVKKYSVYRLVHVETFASPQEAIAREAIEELAPRLENTLDRRRKPGLERSVRSRLTPVVMGPGLRRDDDRAIVYIADSILSPQ
jgi:predicted GIY-YIG superfamily endonuclease